MTLSTFDAEYVACFEATGHALWMRGFIPRLHVMDTISKLLKIYGDNDAARRFSQNDKVSSKSKFMEVKYLVLTRSVSVYHWDPDKPHDSRSFDEDIGAKGLQRAC